MWGTQTPGCRPRQPRALRQPRLELDTSHDFGFAVAQKVRGTALALKLLPMSYILIAYAPSMTHSALVHEAFTIARKPTSDVSLAKKGALFLPSSVVNTRGIVLYVISDMRALLCHIVVGIAGKRLETDVVTCIS